MAHTLKETLCIQCKAPYTPASGVQRYCLGCRAERRRVTHQINSARQNARRRAALQLKKAREIVPKRKPEKINWEAVFKNSMLHVDIKTGHVLANRLREVRNNSF